MKITKTSLKSLSDASLEKLKKMVESEYDSRNTYAVYYWPMGTMRVSLLGIHLDDPREEQDQWMFDFEDYINREYYRDIDLRFDTETTELDIEFIRREYERGFWEKIYIKLSDLPFHDNLSPRTVKKVIEDAVNWDSLMK